MFRNSARRRMAARPHRLLLGFFRRLTNYYHDDWFPPPQSPSHRQPRSAEAWAALSAGFAASAQQRLGLRRLPGHRGSRRQQLSADDCDQWRKVTIEDLWLDRAGVNGSTSSHTNLPEVYDQYPDAIHLDQLLLYAERLPDTVQTRALRLGLPLHRGLWHGLSLLHRERLLLPATAEIQPAIRS